MELLLEFYRKGETMPNPRIQAIENQILELAQKDAELYPANMSPEQISHHHSPALGN
jgi:hypothetical protein